MSPVRSSVVFGSAAPTSSRRRRLGFSERRTTSIWSVPGRKPECFLLKHDDFLRLHAAGVEHGGIAYAPQSTSIGDIVRGLMLICQVLNADDMQNHVEYL